MTSLIDVAHLLSISVYQYISIHATFFIPRIFEYRHRYTPSSIFSILAYQYISIFSILATPSTVNKFSTLVFGPISNLLF